MLSKIEKIILKECNEVTGSDIYLIEIYNNMKHKPDFKEYYAAMHSLNEKGYFDEYDECLNDTCVSLSTKGFNYKKDAFLSSVRYFFEFIAIPIIIGVLSSIITAVLLE